MGDEILKKIVLTFTLLLSTSLFADAKLTVEKATIQNGNTARFTIEAKGKKDIKLPKITSVAGYEVNQAGGGGSFGSSGKGLSETYSFTPDADVTIPSYTVMIDGKAYKTKPASIKVIGNSLERYDKLFKAINKKRYGLTEKEIEKTKSPFVLVKQKIVSADGNNTSEPVYILKGIINDRANINGRWYKLNDTIDEYKLTKIKSNSVTIDNAGNPLELKMNTKGKENVVITIE